MSLVSAVPGRTGSAWALSVGAGALVLLSAVTLAGGVTGFVLVVALLVAGTTLLLGAVRPEWAVVLILGFAFLRLGALGGAESVPIVLAAAFGAVSVASTWSQPKPDVLSPFLGICGFYVGLGLMSSAWAAAPDQSVSGALNLAMLVALAAGIIACVHDMRALRFATWTLVLAGSFVGLLAIRQYVTKDWSNAAFGLSRASVEQIVGEVNDYRAGGPVASANFFGQMMVVALALSIERASATIRLQRIVAVAAASIAGFTILITYSRGALIAAVVVVGLAILRSPNRGRVIAIMVAAFAVLLVLGPANYSDRLAAIPAAVGIGQTVEASGVDPALQGRSSSWLVAQRMVVDHPIAGAGLGNFESNYLSYSADLGRDHRGEPRAAHSQPLEVLAETGILGFTCLLGVVGGAFFALSRGARRLRVVGFAGDVSVLQGLRDALVGYLIAGIFLHDAFPQLFWILVALGWASTSAVAGVLPVKPSTTEALASSGLVDG